ncbi:MAG: hypothetical protein ABIJ21_05460 [Nanoarchaeota archaeon]
MAKFHEAEQRILVNIFVCRKCKSKVRAPNLKVISGKVRCRKCHSHYLRSVKRK